MEAINIKEVWKNSKFENKVFSNEEIVEITRKRDKNIFKNIIHHTQINFFTKVLISIVILILFLMFEMSHKLLLFNFSLIVISISLSVYDLGFANGVSEIQISSEDLASNLGRLKKFFSTNYGNYRIISAFSNPLLVIVGIQFYALIVHNDFKLNDTEDVVVFLIIISLAYFIALIANNRISKGISDEIESSFVEFENEKEMTSFLLSEEKRKKKLRLFYITLIILGLITFLICILFYLLNE